LRLAALALALCSVSGAQVWPPNGVSQFALPVPTPGYFGSYFIGDTQYAMVSAAVQNHGLLLATAQAEGGDCPNGKDTGTSSTSRIVAAGSPSFTTQTGKSWSAGMAMVVRSISSPTTLFQGTLATYTGGILTLNSSGLKLGGVGTTRNDWEITPADCDGYLWQQEYAWMIANRERLGVKFALHVGDLTDISAPEEFTAAMAGLNALDAAGIKVFAIPGNHDMDYLSDWDNYIAALATFYAGKSYVYSRFGAGVKGGAESLNGSYMNVAFTAAIQGQPFLVVGLQYAPSSAAIAWGKSTAEAWLAANPTGRVWVLTHSFGTTCVAASTCATVAVGNMATDIISTEGIPIWDEWLDDVTYVEAVIYGHYNPAGNNLNTGYSPTNSVGKRIWFIGVDQQFRDSNSLVVARIKQKNGAIDACVYSPKFSTWVSWTGTSGITGDLCATALGVADWPLKGLRLMPNPVRRQ
jgi:hypothetical protein